jgi:hypothetical protein
VTPKRFKHGPSEIHASNLIAAPGFSEYLGTNFVSANRLITFQHVQLTGGFISFVLCTHHVKLSEFTLSYTKQILKFKLVDSRLRLSSFAHNSGERMSQAALISKLFSMQNIVAADDSV